MTRSAVWLVATDNDYFGRQEPPYEVVDELRTWLTRLRLDPDGVACIELAWLSDGTLRRPLVVLIRPEQYLPAALRHAEPMFFVMQEWMPAPPEWLVWPGGSQGEGIPWSLVRWAPKPF
jgi:hypothetical protein